MRSDGSGMSWIQEEVELDLLAGLDLADVDVVALEDMVRGLDPAYPEAVLLDDYLEV